MSVQVSCQLQPTMFEDNIEVLTLPPPQLSSQVPPQVTSQLPLSPPLSILPTYSWQRSRGRFRATDHGFEIDCQQSMATTHIDCPCTVRKGTTDLFKYPHRFQTLIMDKSVSLQMFRREQLHEIMLQCFESPFDPPHRSPDSRGAVRVEFAGNSKQFAHETRSKLRKMSMRSSSSAHDHVNTT